MSRGYLEQHLRDRTAAQIRGAIESEKNKEMKINRTGADYVRSLLGIQHLLEYVRDLDSQLVLDCGAGNTLGISEISKAEMAEDLEFHATVLRRIDEEVEANLGSQFTFRTPIETFRAVGDRQYGAMIALNSLAYSETPELAIQSIDRHLVEGGVLKATFIKPQYWHHLEGWNTHEAFSHQLDRLGYDLALASNEADKKVDVLVAIKQGGLMTAEDLLAMDLADWVQQFHGLEKR